MWWIGLAVAGAASPAALDEALRACAGATHPLPAFDEGQRAALLAGEVVRVLDKNPDPERPSTAVGVALLRGSRTALWIGAQDPHTQVDPGLVEFVIEELGPDHALWYGWLDLPRPLHDRQWVVESDNNHPLAAASGGRCWEHRWKAVPDGLPRARAAVEAGRGKGLTPAQVDAAVFTPVNEGGWLMAPVGEDRVLVAYQARSVVGGAVPDWVVAQLAMARLEAVLRAVETRAAGWAVEHYGPEHAGVPGGDGVVLPRLR